MFSADLSWTEPDTEKVGERRQRKARERSSTSNSIKTSASSRSSISGERELWWTSGLKKAKDLKPNILIRPSSHRSNNSKKTTRTTPKKPELPNLKLPNSLKDPALQPPWTYATTLSHTLPSGAHFDLPVHEVPELEGDTSSGRTVSTEARFSRKDFARPCPVIIEGALNFEAVKPRGADRGVATTEKVESCSFETLNPKSRPEFLPLSQWECLSPRGLPQGVHLVPKPPPVKKVAAAHSSTLELTRFQRFIRRMESAGPKTILDRLQEEWHEHPVEDVDEELALEKQLWLLTGFQMQNFGKVRVAPKPTCETGRILELGGVSDICDASAPNVVPLPYPENYFSHIRASTLPSLVPSSKLPELFRECYKLLAPGGLLEIRIMDAAPVRKTTGPLLRTWIEDRLSVNLERLFRCSKPCLLVPNWLTDAGFDLTSPEGEGNVVLPCAYDSSAADVDKELSTTIGRALWKDIWGTFVDETPEEPKWWWEDADILQECLERQTILECRAMFAYKQ
ncbi:hypothetical protein EK21DRAFT_97134 [Setomelanomma holmii]|uniref:Methyltransferase type 11 domain-containing protein n=1 Tax=Setomelanomma holmii TaxID=210430 RepID=A0A9P4HGU7_9PLEO|nr:hypothetical protein EK21DRAFT_97134 [Setomelanomma holmii]